MLNLPFSMKGYTLQRSLMFFKCLSVIKRGHSISFTTIKGKKA